MWRRLHAACPFSFSPHTSRTSVPIPGHTLMRRAFTVSSSASSSPSSKLHKNVHLNERTVKAQHRARGSFQWSMSNKGKAPSAATGSRSSTACRSASSSFLSSKAPAKKHQFIINRSQQHKPIAGTPSFPFICSNNLSAPMSLLGIVNANTSKSGHVAAPIKGLGAFSQTYSTPYGGLLAGALTAFPSQSGPPGGVGASCGQASVRCISTKRRRKFKVRKMHWRKAIKKARYLSTIPQYEGVVGQLKKRPLVKEHVGTPRLRIFKRER